MRLAARIPLCSSTAGGASFAPGTADGDIAIDATVVLARRPPDSLGGLEQVIGGATIPTHGRSRRPVVRASFFRRPVRAGDIVVTTADAVGGAAARC